MTIWCTRDDLCYAAEWNRPIEIGQSKSSQLCALVYYSVLHGTFAVTGALTVILLIVVPLA